MGLRTVPPSADHPGEEKPTRTGVTHLFIPGPTHVPEVVRRAMNVPMEDHRAPDFPTLTRGLFAALKTVFANDDGRVFLYPSSCTGAWEAAITTPFAAETGC